MRYFSQSSKAIIRKLFLSFFFKKKKIFIFFTVRFIVSGVIMSRNYLYIITYAFLKKVESYIIYNTYTIHNIYID